MGLRFFTIPIQDSGASEGELNGFLSSHKVLAIERRTLVTHNLPVGTYYR